MSSINQSEQLIDDAMIAVYLQQHPDFFHRHKELALGLKIPHQEKGAVSLVALRMEQQRARIEQLENEITELMSIASYNEKVFHVYAEIYSQLFNCRSLTQLQRILVTNLQAQLPLAAATVRINEGQFKLKSQYQDFKISPHKLEQIRHQRLAGEGVYFGQINTAEKAVLFDNGTLINSVALMELGDHGQFGLLAVGSANGNHYQPGMDNLLLSHLCRIISLLLPQLIPLRDQTN